MSARGRRLYDWWSRHQGLLSVLYDLVSFGRLSALRERAIGSLALEPGDRVLELGCGAGTDLGRLREVVGETGTVLGVDYSPGMVARARRRIDERGWDNVHVVRADATRPGVSPGTFDAAYAAMSVSAMPDPGAVFEAAADALTPEGRIAVVDTRPFQSPPWTLLNALLVPLFRWTTDWNPGADVVEALERAVPEVSVRDYQDGTLFVATGRKRQTGTHGE